MTGTTLSTKRNRAYKRAFDWDEAARMRHSGMTLQAIADRFGVSQAAVRRVVVPGLRERVKANGTAWAREHRPHAGICPDCGGVASAGRYQPGARCRACDTKRRATTVRDDTLRCTHCLGWKADAEFPIQRDRKSRRGRHGVCRDCQPTVRRAYRARNPGRDAATARARRRARAST